MMNGGAERREEERSHAKGAEGAERKAGHGWGMMEDDVLPRRDTAQRKGWRGCLMLNFGFWILSQRVAAATKL